MVVLVGCGSPPEVQPENPSPSPEQAGSRAEGAAIPPHPQAAKHKETEKPPVGRDEMLAIWRSDSVAPERKAEAVNKLFPSGASPAEVQALLGHGVWSRRHGSNYEFSTNGGSLGAVPTGSFLEVSLDYPLPGGCVSVLFDESSGRGGFGRAVYRKTVKAGGH
jgi:hypothetical protein